MLEVFRWEASQKCGALLFLVPLLLLRDGCRCLCVHVCGQAVCRELCM